MFSSIQSNDEKGTCDRENGSGREADHQFARERTRRPPADIPCRYCLNNRCGLVVGPTGLEYTDMRLLLALIIIIYLVGVGVVLSPIIRSTWNSEPASALADHIIQALPDALVWPARAVHTFTGS